MVDPVVPSTISGASSTPVTPPAQGANTQAIEGVSSAAENPSSAGISALPTSTNSASVEPLTLGPSDPLTLGAPSATPPLTTKPVNSPSEPPPPPDLPGTVSSSPPATNNPNANLPNISQMQTTLPQTGTLLPEIEVQATATAKVDTSPLAALQPDKIKEVGEPDVTATQITAVRPDESHPPLQRVTLGNTTQQYTSQAASISFRDLPYWIFGAIVLLIQATIGAAQFLHFVFTQYPALDQAVLSLQLAEEELNVYLFKIGILSFLVVTSVVISLVLLLHNKLRSNIAMLGLCLALIIINLYVQNSYVLPHLLPGNPMIVPQVITELQTPVELPAELPSGSNENQF